MKFDAIIGNPPYNAPKILKEGSEKHGAGTTLWDKFVFQSFNCLKQDGYLCFIHPMGWRSFTGDYVKVAEIYKKYNLLMVQMNNSKNGLKVFGAGTAFDVVIVQKSDYQKKTTFVDFDGKTSVHNITNWKCIPSGMFDKIIPILAKKNEEKCEVLYSRSAYGSDKPNISTTKTSKFKYPVIHAINVKNEPTFLHSNVNNRRLSKTDFRPMFQPKVLFGRRECGTALDLEGEFGCSQHTCGITDKKENLPKILKALRSEEFISIMRCLSWNSTAQDKYDKNAFSLIRKDFWKDFQ